MYLVEVVKMGQVLLSQSVTTDTYGESLWSIICSSCLTVSRMVHNLYKQQNAVEGVVPVTNGATLVTTIIIRKERISQ